MSRTLDVVFLEGVRRGEEVVVEAGVVRVGRRLGEFLLFWFFFFWVLGGRMNGG